MNNKPLTSFSFVYLRKSTDNWLKCDFINKTPPFLIEV